MRKVRSDKGISRGTRRTKIVKTNESVQEQVNQKYENMNSVVVHGVKYIKVLDKGIIRFVPETSKVQ